VRLKVVGPYWAVRVSRGYRALATRKDNDFYWFWIGPHDEYERLLNEVTFTSVLENCRRNASR
jgi:hypothetical protein